LSATADQFAKSLVAAGLFTADEVQALWNALPSGERPRDGETFAQLLTMQQKLTPFQASELIAGSQTPLVLGDYVLLDKIGAGGMGQVFKAQHRHMKRLAAIKLLPPELTKDEAAVKRFQREVEAAARLSHPHIVQTYDAGVQRGVWYLVMEYVDGRDLASVVVGDGPLPVAQAIDYIRQAALGLAFAHESGVVHRDVKPANLLLDKKGVVKILDLGLARLEGNVAEREGLTASGLVMGTVDFMAPEQAFDTHTADARADIYSLGCTLFRLLTNRNLYEGNTLVKKLMSHQQSPIPSLAAARTDAPAALIPIFMRMVAKQPDDRYQTMAEVAAALASLSVRGWEPLSPTIAPMGSCSVTKTPDPGLGRNIATLEATSSFAADPGAVPATVSLQSPLQSTDPVSERSIQIARDKTSRITTAGSTPWWRTRLAMIAGGSGALLLAFSIWTFFNRKPAQITVPPGGSVAIVSDPANPPKPAIAPFNAQRAKQHQTEWAAYLKTEIVTTNSVGAKMVLIPPGEFLMGSTDEQVSKALELAQEDSQESTRNRIERSERPQHLVIFSKPLLIGATEVTVGQFKRFSASGYVTEAEKEEFKAKASPPPVIPGQPTKPIETYLNPGYTVDDESPASVITWNDAVAYCNWLSVEEKLDPCYRFDVDGWLVLPNQNGYRLPTEAEWEYACRAGTTTQFSFGDDDQELAQYSWYDKNAGGRTHAVGTKPANPFGLFDMHGNAQEWCQDYYDEKWYEKTLANDPLGPISGSTRVLRSGLWKYSAPACRSAYRYSFTPSYRFNSYGFRYVRSLKAHPETTTSKPEPTPRAPVGKTPETAQAPFTAVRVT
jgi:serine/threonine-protein kinase